MDRRRFLGSSGCLFSVTGAVALAGCIDNETGESTRERGSESEDVADSGSRDLALENAQFVHHVSDNQDLKPFDTDTYYRPAARLYAEPAGMIFQDDEKITDWEVTIELTGPDGSTSSDSVVQWSIEEPIAEGEDESLPEDYALSERIELPDPQEPGQYEATVTLTDHIANESVTIEESFQYELADLEINVEAGTNEWTFDLEDGLGPTTNEVVIPTGKAVLFTGTSTDIWYELVIEELNFGIPFIPGETRSGGLSVDSIDGDDEIEAESGERFDATRYVGKNPLEEDEMTADVYVVSQEVYIDYIDANGGTPPDALK